MLHVGLQFHLINQATSTHEKVRLIHQCILLYTHLISYTKNKSHTAEPKNKLFAFSNKCHHES